MKKTIVIAVIMLLTLACSQQLRAGDREELAVAASNTWLKLVDGGSYTESWKEGAEYFRNAVTVEQWESSMKAFRKPLGRVISRRLNSKEYASSLPGAPDGQYVVIRYSTSFEKKASAIETVTPMKDTDGKWRVSGYFIK
jgi:hypothetical protein